jgi:Cu-Zn family superoxide dismutase
MIIMKIVFLCAQIVLSARSAFAELNPDIALQNTPNRIFGNVTLNQESEDLPVSFRLILEGLVPNSEHGWHVHARAVENENCTTSGLHFNPENKDHGAPDDENRHHGDLGNFQADGNGVVDITVNDQLMSLYYEGEFSPIGRGVVIHERQDDLGRGNAPSSKTVGNAGGRLACGNLILTGGNPTTTGDSDSPVVTTTVSSIPSIPTLNASTSMAPLLILSLLAFL